jgi:glycosyltransferase involved in cell wall biosynthesis
VLNLELFYDHWRAQAYRRMCRQGWRVQYLIYDFMPWLHPELFPQGISRGCMEYLRALRDVPEVAFISQQTRAEYNERVMRGRGRPGPVLPLGADGLGLERQSWSISRHDIVMIGTIEKRKNVHTVMDAFRLLWARGIENRLVLAGRIDPALRSDLDVFATEARQRLALLDHPTDSELRDILRGARGVLSASSVEGFGLPPYEALYSGIPAIAAEALPSIQSLPLQGHIRVAHVTPEALADAVQSLIDDDTAARLWSEAAGLELPGWGDFIQALVRWTETKPG